MPTEIIQPVEIVQPAEVKEANVENALRRFMRERTSAVANGVKSFGIVGAVAGFMTAVAGKIGESSGAPQLLGNNHHINLKALGQVAEYHDYMNAFNAGLIATAAGLGIWAAGRFIQHRKEMKAQQK